MYGTTNLDRGVAKQDRHLSRRHGRFRRSSLPRVQRDGGQHQESYVWVVANRRQLHPPYVCFSVNLFKARVDRFWANQDVKYDFAADLTGIGDRSQYEICEM